MKYPHWVSWHWLVKKLRRQLLTGVLIVVPLGATMLILVWLFTSIDNILQPVIQFVWRRSMPGIGFGATIILIYLVGVFASNVIGRRVIKYGESLLARVPLVRPLYLGIKQILESFSAPGKAGFVQVVLIEFPRKGIWSIGFITKESSAQSGESHLNVFIPTSPNPTSGFLQIVREEEVIRTDIPVDEALKMVISAGKLSPQGVGDKLLGKIK